MQLLQKFQEKRWQLFEPRQTGGRELYVLPIKQENIYSSGKYGGGKNLTQQPMRRAAPLVLPMQLLHSLLAADCWIMTGFPAPDGSTWNTVPTQMKAYSLSFLMSCAPILLMVP